MAQDKIRETVEDAASTLKAAGADAIEATQEEARAVLGSAREKVMSELRAQADAGRDFIADKARDAAARLCAQAAEETGSLRGRMLGIIAGGASDLAQDLRRHSLPALLAETEAFARRNPGAFVGGAALAGFALARFQRATAAPRHATPSMADRDGASRSLGDMVSQLHTDQDGA